MSDETLLELAEHIAMRRGNDVVETKVAFGELTVTATLSSVVGLIEFLRSDASCRFSTLIDITAVDHPDRPARFDLVCHLLSMYRNQRIRVKVQLREDEIAPSLTGIFPGANWYEREVFDLLWYHGLTQDEAAALIGVSVRTVKSRWRSARLRIAEALGGELPGA